MKEDNKKTKNINKSEKSKISNSEVKSFLKDLSSVKTKEDLLKIIGIEKNK